MYIIKSMHNRSPNFVLCILITLILLHSCQSKKLPNEGMEINTSTHFKKGMYVLNVDTSSEKAAISISGENIVVDFAGSTIMGNTDSYHPDSFTGIGILIENGKNITLKNVQIRGYKIGIQAVNVAGLIIENSDLSYNYRPRLHSIREREDFADWLSYHQNDDDEWLRFGAGIYLKDCPKATIRNNKASQNQNALLMSRCDSAQVYNNIFTFNSGLGIGIYRSSHNSFMHNCLDFNVRGHSEGFYRRGQDSAGALFYEQSSGNIFCYNSATHSGDGFFLWAGNETMNSGEGGCNNNIIAYNDFSYAPTNGIEVTFSSNFIIGNTMSGCRYGVWGGYSYYTLISDNIFQDNEFGVAIEHGHDNAIVNNSFNGDKTGIKLWERTSQPTGWGFAEKRDVSSRNYRLSNNSFTGVDKPFDITDTHPIDSTRHVSVNIAIPATLEDGMNAIALYHFEGTDKIRVNDYGPYNYEYPAIWLLQEKDNQFDFLISGKEGKWKIIDMEGFFPIDHSEGNIGDTLTLKRRSDAEYISVSMVYDGPVFTDQFGNSRSGGYEFSFDLFDKKMNWETAFYIYDDSTDPILSMMEFRKLLETKPIHVISSIGLYHVWWGSPVAGVAPDQFATISRATGFFQEGMYEISFTGDDGFRVYVDGEIILEEWNYQEPLNASTIVSLNGNHEFKVEHFDAEGFSTIDFKIKKLAKTVN